MIPGFRIVLLYPLSSFFAIFCHVIDSSSHRDLILLEEVTEGLAMFAEFNTPLQRAKDLYEVLLSVCRSRLQDRA